MMKIALIGYGKMGKEIEKIAISRGHSISFTIDADNLADFSKLNPQNTDVAIEFTSPHVAFENVLKCFEQNISVVCGSTGWNENLDKAKEKCKEKNLAFIWASNFSVGVNIFFKLNQHLAKLMNRTDNYEPTMTEIHHIHKKDAPSGTAITLAEGLIENYNKKNNWTLATKNASDSLHIEAVREGEVCGTHIIKYKSDFDYIEITHCLDNRNSLALGAVIAAEFICNKKGIFTMNDVLNF